MAGASESRPIFTGRWGQWFKTSLTSGASDLRLVIQVRPVIQVQYYRWKQWFETSLTGWASDSRLVLQVGPVIQDILQVGPVFQD